jgi:hypothetical protein
MFVFIYPADDGQVAFFITGNTIGKFYYRFPFSSMVASPSF